MEIRNTKDRAEVERMLHWSRQQASAGTFVRVPNWDAKSTWYNDYFKDNGTGKEWVIYLADQAWPGEVKLVSTALATPNQALKPTVPASGGHGGLV